MFLPFDRPSSGGLPRRPRIRSALRRALYHQWHGPRHDQGMSTAEYAVGTLAAVAFAGVLYAVVTSSATHSLISSVVQRALSVSF